MTTRLSRLVLLALWLAPSAALAADWHVAPGGKDTNDGSKGKPLATLAEAVKKAAKADRILLERGGAYQVADLAIGKELTVTAYGSGAAPVITASDEVTLAGSWSKDSKVRTGNVAERVVACFVDGRFVRRARYPNFPDVLFTDGDNGDSTIKDAQLAQRPGVTAGRWTGAQVRWRRWSWHWERRLIQDHSAADTLKLSADGRVTNVGNVGDGSGYFIDGDLDELDAPGEWHWQSGKLYVYPPSWANPATMKVTVVTTSETAPWIKIEDVKAGVTASAKATFRGVHFSMFHGTALKISGPATVERCTFSEIGETGVRYTWNAQPFTVRESVFRDIRNVGVQGWADPNGATGSLIERNLFHRIGVEKGYGGNGPWHAAGAILGNGKTVTFRLNRVVDTGYCGIILGSPGMVVERNVFVRTMSTLNDGGAVYTNCDASVIRDNIILDTLGDLSTSHPWYPLGSGIWPEFLSEFKKTQIVGNTVYGSNGQGIFLPNNYECTVTDNVLLERRRPSRAHRRRRSRSRAQRRSRSRAQRRSRSRAHRRRRSRAQRQSRSRAQRRRRSRAQRQSRSRAQRRRRSRAPL
jgi:parallel beta-helix repeat protein